MLLYKPVHYLVHNFHDGKSEVTFTDLDEAFDAADAHNYENRLQPGDSGYALVHTEYQRDDETGNQYRWTVDLTDEGELHVTDEPQRYPHQAIIRSVYPAKASEDQAPTFKVWYGNAAGTVVYKWQVGVIAKTRRAAYRSAVHALGARQASLKATEAAAEYPDDDTGLDPVLQRVINSRLGDEDENTDPRIRDGYDFPRTPRGYPYEGPHNVPGASNAAVPAVNGRTLAHHVDEDMNAMEGRVDLMERQFAGLIAKLGLVKVNDNPIIYRRLGPGGFQAPATPTADDFQDVTPLIKPWIADGTEQPCKLEPCEPETVRLARDIIGMIDYARTTRDETGVDAFMEAVATDPRIHPEVLPAIADVITPAIPVIMSALTAMDARNAMADVEPVVVVEPWSAEDIAAAQAAMDEADGDRDE